jgi:hypothetical protein
LRIVAIHNKMLTARTQFATVCKRVPFPSNPQFVDKAAPATAAISKNLRRPRPSLSPMVMTIKTGANKNTLCAPMDDSTRVNQANPMRGARRKVRNAFRQLPCRACPMPDRTAINVQAPKIKNSTGNVQLGKARRIIDSRPINPNQTTRAIAEQRAKKISTSNMPRSVSTMVSRRLME